MTNRKDDDTWVTKALGNAPPSCKICRTPGAEERFGELMQAVHRAGKVVEHRQGISIAAFGRKLMKEVPALQLRTCAFRDTFRRHTEICLKASDE